MSVKEKPAETEVLLMTEADHTLCLTCKNRKLCTYLTPGIPVYYCEEFENNSAPPAVKNQKKTSAMTLPQNHSNQAPSTQKYQGLCGDCANNLNCAFSNSDLGGIWHCEEYC